MRNPPWSWKLLPLYLIKKLQNSDSYKMLENVMWDYRLQSHTGVNILQGEEKWFFEKLYIKCFFRAKQYFCISFRNETIFGSKLQEKNSRFSSQYQNLINSTEFHPACDIVSFNII